MSHPKRIWAWEFGSGGGWHDEELPSKRYQEYIRRDVAMPPPDVIRRAKTVARDCQTLFDQEFDHQHRKAAGVLRDLLAHFESMGE